MLRASGQDRSDVRQARRRWKRQQPGLDPQRPIFLDETGAKTNMTRLRAAPPGASGRMPPCGRWQSTTMIRSIRLDGTIACMTIPGATDTEVFRTYIAEVPCPELRPGDIVIRDNLGAH